MPQRESLGLADLELLTLARGIAFTVKEPIGGIEWVCA